jgi:hypothetical protein
LGHLQLGADYRKPRHQQEACEQPEAGLVVLCAFAARPSRCPQQYDNPATA